MRYLLLLVFSILIIAFAISVKKNGIREICNRMRYMLLPSLCFSLTVSVFLPDNLILNNMSDFLIGYGTVFLFSAVVFIICMVFLMLAAAIIGREVRGSSVNLLLTSVAILLYIQSNWLNPRLPELDGRVVPWENYRFHSVFDLIIWLVILIVPQVMVLGMDMEQKRSDKYMNYISVILIAIQAVALIITLILPKDIRTPNVRLTEDGEFTVGSEKNVIVFVLDSLGTPNYEAALSEHPEIRDMLEDFTFFSNEISGGSYTELGIPTLLTGVEYEPDGMSYYEYLSDAWGTVDIYEKLKDLDYDIRLYTDNRYVVDLKDNIISNAVSADIDYVLNDKTGFTRQLYKLVGYYAFPTTIKRFFWMNTTDITRYISPSDTIYEKSDLDAIFFNDAKFYEDYKKSGGLSPEFDNAYRVYHLVGAHPPYVLNAEGERVSEEDTTANEQIAGCFKIVGDYIADMKRLGLYDRSTVIITADHGPGGYEYGIQQNACLLVKQSGVSHPYEENKTPVHVRNLFATIADEAGIDYIGYGPGIWDIYDDSDVERLHTARRASIGQRFPEIPEDVHSVRFITGKDGTDPDSIEILNGLDRNKTEYSIGDIIDFREKSGYTDVIDYRVYYDDSGATCSNELYLNFLVDGEVTDDLKLNFTFDHVYNDDQKVRIYAEGERIATLDCTTEDIGEVYTVIIPQDNIREGLIPLRFVFPGAVTPHMIDSSSDDHRVLSVTFDKMWIE